MRPARPVALALLALLLVACAVQSQPPEQEPSPEPDATVVASATPATAELSPSAVQQTVSPSDTPIPSPTAATPASATPSPTPTSSPTPQPERVQVFGSGNQFVNMRRDPGTDSPVLKSIRDGTEVIVVGIDRESDGRIWRNVQDGDTVGWIVSTALRSFPTPTVTPSMTATSAATPTSTSTPTAPPSATAPPPPTAVPTLATPTATVEPERVDVAGTGGLGGNLRAEPGTDGRLIQNLLDGTRLTVIGPDREVDGRTWRNVRGESGIEGWIAAEVVQSVVTPTPVPTATVGSTPTASETGTPRPAEPGEPDGESPEEPAEPTPEPERVEVYGTDPQGANLRAQPGRTGSVLRSVPDGSVLTIVGEDRSADGVTWRNVQTEDGATGWLALEVIRTLIIPTPTPRPGAPGIGAPIEAEPAPEEEQSEEERAATPCRPGQVKGDAVTGIYYPAEHPEYAGLRLRVRCFDDISRARASGFRPPEVQEPAPEASPEPAD